MLPLLTLVPLFLSFSYFTTPTHALSSCVAFDINWNLLAFGFGGKDYSAGTQDAWGGGSPTDITATGRPPFDTDTVNCFLSQFGNAIYILGADKSDATSIYIYDATAKSWSKQATTPGKFDYSNYVTILDRDTDFFYALSNGELYALNMTVTKKAVDTPYEWKDIQAPPFSVQDYQPVMALGSNHIHFINVPSVPAGSAEIFVIHFSFFQPQVQKYGDFPAQHGQTASIFLDTSVQEEFVYIPDDGSQTYVVNVISNTTQTLAAPPEKDSKATYFASPNSIVQLASSGTISFFPYNAKDTSANSAASWSSVKTLSSVFSSGGSNPANTDSPGGNTNTNTAGGTATTGGPKSTQTGNSTGGGDSNSPGAAMTSRSASLGMVGAVLLGTIALMFV